MNSFQYAVRPAPLPSSLRDTAWRQRRRHSERRHSSLLPQSLCGRLSSSASVFRVAGSALVRMWDLCRADMSSCHLPPHHVHACGWKCSCEDVPLEHWKPVVSGMCDSDEPNPTWSGCHMLLASCLCCAGATSPQRVVARWIWFADGSCFTSAWIFPWEHTAPCWQLKGPVKVILSLMCLRV